jgi:hypothetical protein
LEDTGDSTQPDPPIQHPHRHRWSWLIRYIKRELHKRRAKKQQESPTDRAARKTSSATIWIAVFTVVLAFVSGFTLYEVIEGSSDTHTLAEAAKRQAEVASYALCETQRNNLIEQRLLDANRVSADSSAADSLEATIRNSNLDQRAWIGVDRIDGVPELNKQFIVSVTIRNTGKTFAKHVVMASLEEGRVDEAPLNLEKEFVKNVNSIALIPLTGSTKTA